MSHFHAPSSGPLHASRHSCNHPQPLQPCRAKAWPIESHARRCLIRSSAAFGFSASLFSFSNTLPDYIVTAPAIRSDGGGGILAAGYWGNSWEWRADISYTKRCVPSPTAAAAAVSGGDSSSKEEL